MSDKSDAPSLAEVTAANRAAWDASAPLHLGDGFDRLLERAREPGFSTLDETLTATLRALGPTGKRVVQICCNNGRELFSLPSLGAVPALGIDQSSAFLDQAAQIGATSGITCDFLCADIYDLPPEVPSDFDIVLITIGAVGWMPDLPRFFEIAAGLLRPGGHLVMYETHPFLEMFDPSAEDPFKPTRPYFLDGPDVDDTAITYDGPTDATAGVSYWFVHTFSQITMACIGAGLSIERLEEHGHSNREAEFDIYECQSAQLPMCFTLVARKPT